MGDPIVTDHRDAHRFEALELGKGLWPVPRDALLTRVFLDCQLHIFTRQLHALIFANRLRLLIEPIPQPIRPFDSRQIFIGREEF